MDDVSKFLQDVKEMNARRAEEDDARQRELDEKIQQEKKERQARRAERARSISPQKSSPANTPPPSSHHNTPRLSEGPRLSPALDHPGSPQSQPNAPATSDSLGKETDSHAHADRDSCGPAPAENEPPSTTEAEESKESNPEMHSPSSPSSNAQGPRAMSWQRRRPTHSDRSKSRDLSALAAQNAARASNPPSEPSSATEQSASSRDQIAQALGSKDPTWFRQTADRGHGSPAYRKTQVEDQESFDMSSVRAQLPGMDRRSPSDESKDTPSAAQDDRSERRLGSPLPLSSAPKLDPPAQKSPDQEEVAPGRLGSATGSVSGRSSPTRPVSPTKGMGGFVQSAMMKRSDSVKRWSVTSTPTLTRADSVASNRNSVVGATSHSRSRSRPNTMFRERSDASAESSRPTSRQGAPPESGDGLDNTPKPDNTSRQVPPLDTSVKDEEKTTPPSSPSKTLDARRWSPTKASWLETALNKPESPKPKPTPPVSNQPAWMVELNKAKAQRSSNPPEPHSPRPGSISSKHEVNIGGLMRSSPMGAAAQPSPSGLGGIYSPPPSGHRPGAGSISGNAPRMSPTKPAADKPELKPKPDLEVKEEPEVPVEATEPSKGGSASSQTSDINSTKPKPDTPPKKDFRANLKPRQPEPGPSNQQASEFQNVFGTLRRTKTQNYVAPDELKDNIMRGKAALNATGGPKPSQRKDEFKDAILKKKEDFKKAQAEGKGITRNAATSSASEGPVPEGLARRTELSKSHTGKKDTAADYGIEGSSRKTPGEPVPVSSPPPNASAEPASPPKPTARELPSPGSEKKEATNPGRLAGRTGSSGGLAGRFNPGLAGMLARGPPPMATNGGKDSGESDSKPTSSASEPSAPGPQLTHMTKGRARGPRRKAPTSTQTEPKRPQPSAAASPPTGKENAPPTSVPSAARSPSPPKPQTPFKEAAEAAKSPRSPPLSSSSSSLPQSIQAQVAAKAALKSKPSPSRKEPEAPSSPMPKSPSSPATKAKPTNIASPTLFRRTPSPEKPAQVEIPQQVSQPSSPKKIETRRMSRFQEDGAKDDRNKVAAAVAAAASAVSPKPTPSPTYDSKVPPPLGQISGQDSAVPSPQKSPIKQSSEVSMLLDEFFGTPRPKRDYHVDTTEILMNRPQHLTKIRTHDAQLFQLTGDGKKMPVSPHNERVLFEQDMYICSHDYTDEQAGKRTSAVYFWAGDEVPSSTVEDAQLFASREARALGGQLTKLRQGAETPEFLQALGGVVVTRRGAGNKFDQLAPSALCGRRHLGQVVFDEVDFRPGSLCSGFPYLVAAGGQCFLWKGRGADVDELSCARLIGMDLTLTGELVEVDDGEEPDAFWAAFEKFGDGAVSGSKARPHSADHWRLKPNYDKYSARLFRSDASVRQQILEISPFSQRDLSPSQIHVLDAFFEMYVVVGRDARRDPQHYASFRNALDFAQEYAILASGVEDRPFVPVCTVVLEGVPRDLKRVFRNWRDADSPTVVGGNAAAATGAGGSGGIKRGRSLRVVSLTQALQALSE